MPKIIFATKNQQVQVFGLERNRFKIFAYELLIQSLNVGYFNKNHVLAPLLPDWIINEGTVKAFLYSDQYTLGEYSVSSLAYNTALATGNESVKVAMQIHSYCEVHGYFEPDSFEWLQRAISQGLSSGLYDRFVGWEKLLSLIESSNSEIVMSYSVCDVFPEPSMLTDDHKKQDRLMALPSDILWDKCLKVVKKECTEITPKINYFGKGINGFQLIQLLEKTC